MIYCLTGKLLEKAPDYAVVSCGGVGYLAAIPSTTAGALPAVGDTCTLYTCMNVTENDVSLFGFADKESQTMFRLLTGVSGVGPKVGLAILSVLSPDRRCFGCFRGRPQGVYCGQRRGAQAGPAHRTGAERQGR